MCKSRGGKGRGEEAPAGDWRLVYTSCFTAHMKGRVDR